MNTCGTPLETEAVRSPKRMNSPLSQKLCCSRQNAPLRNQPPVQAASTVVVVADALLNSTVFCVPVVFLREGCSRGEKWSGRLREPDGRLRRMHVQGSAQEDDSGESR